MALKISSLPIELLAHFSTFGGSHVSTTSRVFKGAEQRGVLLVRLLLIVVVILIS